MLRNFRPFAAALGLAVPAATADADPFVTCVQQQLQELGADPGSADGIMGRQTRAAWRRMRAAHQDRFTEPLKALPDLSRETAIHWCRELPAIEAELAAFRPSSGPLLVRASSAIVEAEVRQAYASATAFFQQEYNVSLAGNIGIAAGDQIEQLQRDSGRVKVEVSAYPSDSDTAIREKCGRTDLFHGGAYLKWMYICWSQEKKTPKMQYLLSLRFHLRRVLAHEYVHLLQGEMGGARQSLRNARVQGHKMGPLWLVEGAAEYFAERYSEQELETQGHPIAHWAIHAMSSQKNLGGLQDLETELDIEDYGLAHFAVRLLAETAGEDAVFGFWRSLGRGMNWDQAFLDSFGVELREFELKVMELRKHAARLEEILHSHSLAELLSAVQVPVRIMPLGRQFRF